MCVWKAVKLTRHMAVAVAIVACAAGAADAGAVAAAAGVMPGGGGAGAGGHGGSRWPAADGDKLDDRAERDRAGLPVPDHRREALPAADRQRRQDLAIAGPAARQAWLGGVRSGKVIALCSEGPGAAGPGLSFPDATTGFVACSTVSNSLTEVDTVYRTANSARSWSALPLP